METIKDMGQIEITSQEKVEWRIPTFYDLPQRYDTVIRSPRFKNNDRDWYMEVYPNGRRLYSSLGWFGISALNLNSESCVRSVFVGVTSTASVILTKEEFHGDGFYCCTRLIPTSLFNSWKDIFVPEGDLLLYLEILHEDNFPVDVIYFRLRADDVQRWYKQKFENSHTFIEASTQTEKEIGEEKMRQDLQEILLNGKFSDIVLKMKSHEFKTHSCILAARSPVFSTMMSNDEKVKNAGVVDITGDDAIVFQDFLNYLYTGSVSNLTSENAANLYCMADKYQVNELKQSCRNLMMTSISNDNFCDIFTASLQHDEKELKDACIQFFAKNSLDIIVTCKWQTFYSENPITGNELFIKCLQSKE